MSQKSRSQENLGEKLAKLREQLPDQKDKIFLGLEDLKKTIESIEQDIKEREFATRADNLLAEVKGHRQELASLSGKTGRDLGDIQEELNNFTKKIKELRIRYDREVAVPMADLTGIETRVPEFQASTEVETVKELPEPTVPDVAPRGKVSDLMPRQEPEPTVLAPELPIETEASEPEMPSATELATEAVGTEGERDRLELRLELEEKRDFFVAKKRKSEKGSGLIARLSRFFTRRQAEDTGELAKARVDYENARAEYIGADIGKALDERLELVDAEVMEKIRAEQWSGNVLRYIIDGYVKLGRMNITTTEWGKKRMEKERWLGKAFLRMLSVRSAVNLGLVGGAGAIAGATAAAGLTASGVLAARRALSAVGVGGLTYDALKARAVAREEQTGLLKKMSKEETTELSTEELRRRKQAIEARNLLDATTHRKSIYKNLSTDIDAELKKRAESEGEETGAASLRAEALRQFIAEADILADNDVLKEYQKKEKRHKAAGVVSGAVVASGIAGVFLKKLGVSDVWRESMDWWKEKLVGAPASADLATVGAEKLAEPSSAEALEGTSEEESLPGEARQLAGEDGESPEDFTARHYDSLVHKGEGVIHVLQRDLNAHPEHLESFRHIKGIEKIIDSHQGVYDEITGKELNRAAWLIENDKSKGFGQELLIKGAPDNVAVVFDDSTDRYKIGTLDDTDIMKKVYGRIEATIEKHSGSTVEFGEIKTKDEAAVEEAVREMEVSPIETPINKEKGLQFPSREEMETLKFAPQDAEELAGIAKSFTPETKTIEVPVDTLPQNSVFENKEEIFKTAGPAMEAPSIEEESLPGEASQLAGEDGEAPPETLQNAVLENYKTYYIKAVNELTAPLEKGAGPAKHISALALETEESGSTEKFIAKVAGELKKAQVFDVANQDLLAKLAPESGVADEELERAVKDDILSRLPDKETNLLFVEKGRGVFTMLEGGSHAMRIEDPGNAGNDYFIYNDKYDFTVDETGNPIARKEGVDYPIEYDFETTPPKIWIGKVKE